MEGLCHMTGYLYVLGCVALTVYGQLIMKWRMAKYAADIPEAVVSKVLFLISLVLDPFVLSGYVSAFCASLFWLLAISKLELSHAYPFMSLSFVLVMAFSFLVFGESMSWYKIGGTATIIAGLVLVSRGG